MPFNGLEGIINWNRSNCNVCVYEGILTIGIRIDLRKGGWTTLKAFQCASLMVPADVALITRLIIIFSPPNIFVECCKVFANG